MILKISYSKGFTLIETLLGILLTGIASSALLLGITQTKLNLESIRVKEKAHQELKEYTENIKSLVASGVDSFGFDPPGGIDVTLATDSKGNPTLTGSLHKEIRRSSTETYSIFYYIHTYLIWQDKGRFFFQKNSDLDNLDTLEFKSYQIRFNK